MSVTNDTTKAILNYLYNLGILAWRQNTTGIPLPNGGFRPGSKKGVGDIVAVLPPSGRHCEIEIKSGRDKMRPEQIGQQKNVEAMGGIYLVVKDYPDFLDKFPEYLL